MSFKQRSSPLKQGVNGMLNTMMGTVNPGTNNNSGFGMNNTNGAFGAINAATNSLNPNNIISNGMTAAQIAYSNTPTGQTTPSNTGYFDPIVGQSSNQPGYYNSPEPASNATASFAPNSWITQGQNAAANATNPVTPITPTASSTTIPANTGSTNRGKNWFGAVPTNTVNGGPQSVMQGTHGAGIRRRDSHNTTIYDRTNRGQMFSNTTDNTITDPSSMFSPLPQLKKEQMEYNKINPKAFSASGTIEKMMGKAVPNSPFMQMVDPLTGIAIDPTMSQDPNAPIPPPMGVQTPTTPTYDINNQ